MEQVGAKLRGARTLRGMSIEDVAQVTKIPRAALIAIEADDLAALPAPVFVRGFIRAFAVTVGLDPAPLIRSFDQHLDAASDTGRRRGGASDSLLPLAHAAAMRRGSAGVRNGYVLLVVIAAGLMLAAWLMVGGQRPKATSGPGAVTTPVVIQERVDGVSSINDAEEAPTRVR